MCPGTLALVATAASAGGSILQGVSAGQSAHYQAQIASHNADIARQNAIYTASATAAQTQEAGLKARAQNAGVRAGIAANNLDVNTGSPADVEQSQREIGQLNTETVANRGAEQVYGQLAQSADYTAQSRLYASEVNKDYLAGGLKAIGSVAGGAPDLPGGSGGASPSLLSGEPSVPEGYAWMSNAGQNPGDLQYNEDTWGL